MANEIVKIKEWIEKDYQFKVEIVDINGVVLSVIRRVDDKIFDLDWEREFKDSDLKWNIARFMPDFKHVLLREEDDSKVTYFPIPINGLGK